MKRTALLTALFLLAVASAPGCLQRDRVVVVQPDGATDVRSTDARKAIASDAGGSTVAPDTRPAARDLSSGPLCPAPCPKGEDCVALYPDSTAGICLRPCSSGCGGCGGPPGAAHCSQCMVEVSGVKYCMDFCWWKGDSLPCPDPANQACVDAYSVPNNLMLPGYPGSKVCVPR